MDKYELDDIIFDKVCEVFYFNGNWIKYGDLLNEAFELIKKEYPQIQKSQVENWIKNCIDNEYISVAKGDFNKLSDDDYCRGEWLGLDDEN